MQRPRPRPPPTDKYTADKEKWCGDANALKKRNELAQLDIARLEGSYQRMVSEKERLQGAAADAALQATKRQDQVRGRGAGSPCCNPPC